MSSTPAAQGSSEATVPLANLVSARWRTATLVSPLEKPCDDLPMPRATFTAVSDFTLSNALLVSHFMLYDIDSRWSEAALRTQLLAIGFSEVAFFPKDLVVGDALKGFVATAPDLVYMHVKGTTGNFGWLQNAKFTTWPAGDLFPDSGWQHVGFRDYYRTLKDTWKLEERLLDLSQGKKPILFSGHSQGAAVALLAAARAKANGLNVLALYDSGQPRAGDANFERRLATTLEGRWHRLQYEDDVVPHMPPRAQSSDPFNRAAAKLASVGVPLSVLLAPAHYAHGAGIVLSSDGTTRNVTEADDATGDVAFWTRAALAEGAPEALSAKLITDDHYPEKYHCALARALRRAGN